MTVENYIQKYYNLPKCTCKKNYLTIYVRTSIYNQYYQSFLEKTKNITRKNNNVAKRLCEFWFLIHFNCSLGNYRLSNDLFRWQVNNPNQVNYYKHLLEEYNAIQYKSTVNISKSKYYVQQTTKYSISEIEHNLDFSSKSYKEIKYWIYDSNLVNYLNRKLINNAKYLLKYSNNNTNNITIDIGLSYSQLTDCPSNDCSRICNMYRKFDFDKFTKLYQKLSLRDFDGTLDYVDRCRLEKATLTLQNSVCYLHPTEHRFYHYFHELPKELRPYLCLDNEKLVENFDVHNCHYTMLAAILDSSIPEKEYKDYYFKTSTGIFYEDIARFAGWNSREDAKNACVKYLNLDNKKISRSRKCLDKGGYPTYIYEAYVDKYFETFFPNVRNFIYSNKDTIRQSINEAETKLIVNCVIRDLYEKYGIEALSLHDGIFMKESDAKWLKDNDISTEKMFFDYLNIYNFI